MKAEIERLRADNERLWALVKELAIKIPLNSVAHRDLVRRALDNKQLEEGKYWLEYSKEDMCYYLYRQWFENGQEYQWKLRLTSILEEAGIFEK